MWASSALRPKKHGGSFGFYAAVAKGCAPHVTEGDADPGLVTGTGEPKLERGIEFPPVFTLEETRSTVLVDAALPDVDTSSVGSPRLALRAARPSANCSCITA